MEPLLAAGCVLWRRTPGAGGERPPGEGLTAEALTTEAANGVVPSAGGSPATTLQPPSADSLAVCLVHRPKYDDWSHPKGKLKRNEDALAGALREVREETGCDCVPGAELPTVHYLVDGRPKEVRYWAAEAGKGSFEASDEVDRVEWLAPEAARARLTQERDRELVDALLDTLRRS
ncbi:NUDIX hydrolase [Streptomyces sp. CWNU-1]|uniref:NUDIX hydrolase n=1 Tax=Streptomyces albipurpureus TaxID=2897419 RepID=A0ABT0V0C6_9ACTN|nr:NUDIX hydrolase [Streptomyces sp. CWNU-1]MCM2394287.1 NUDIX hydrolase [Streptomyces sp. CWNU-1]